MIRVRYTPPTPPPSLSHWGYTPTGNNNNTTIMSNRKTLEFIETLTVEEFKEKNNVSKLEVKRAKGSSALFFTWGSGSSKTGAVRSEGIPTKPMISLVKGDVTERNPDGKFWLLHQEGEGGAETIATL